LENTKEFQVLVYGVTSYFPGTVQTNLTSS